MNPFLLVVSIVSCLSLISCLVCSLQPCGHLLGNALLLGSLVYCVFCVLSLSHMCLDPH